LALQIFEMVMKTVNIAQLLNRRRFSMEWESNFRSFFSAISLDKLVSKP